ncbi:MAG: GAF domain-containing protein [Cyclobacteriaceae bacterium]
MQFNWLKKSITRQLIVYWLCISLTPLLLSALIFYHFSKEAILQRSFEQLSSIRETKKMQLYDFFDFQLNLVDILAESPTVITALTEFDSVYQQGVESAAYLSVNEQYHPYLAKIKETYGLYDVFLVNLKGDIIYTVVHEPDFATNLVDGPYRDQNIAEAYKKGLAQNTLIDFDHYAPSQGQAASFVASPIRDAQQQTLGVLITQLPLDKIDAITQERSGLGETGETYIVGKDFLMRSDSRFSEESTVLELEVKTAATEAALTGQTGTRIIEDYRGKHVLSSFAPLAIAGLHYAIIAEIDEGEILAPVTRLSYLMWLIAGISVILVSLVAYYLSRSFTLPVISMKDIIEKLADGILPDTVPSTDRTDELGDVARAIAQMTTGYSSKAAFARQLGEGKLQTEYTSQSQDDVLGNALISMREQLLQNEEENSRRNWSAEGLASFMQLLREHEDVQQLGREILSRLVNYLQANQAALFVRNEEGEESWLEMIACYAYGRQKHFSKRIHAGEGLAGQALLEKETILLTEIPQDYLAITSGLGEANPNCVLLVPLKINEEVEGILELASFKVFREHEISFVEKLGETIAASLRSMKVSQQTILLLSESRQKTEEMQAQEEEMRQNMEELAATQEEMRRKEQAYLNRIQELEQQLSTETS